MSISLTLEALSKLYPVFAGTGHRPNKLFARDPYSIDSFNSLLDYLKDWLASQVVFPKAIISGMALGFDQAWAQAALDFGIPLIAAVPFDGQQSRWPQESRSSYASLLARASLVHIVTPGPYAAWKMQVRNRWMVDHSSHLIALWNHDMGGGTWNCIDYARQAYHTIELIPGWNFPAHV